MRGSPLAKSPRTRRTGASALALLNSLEILTHVRFVAGQKRELRGAQQVLRSMFDELRGAKAFDERAGLPVGPQKGKIFECSVEIRIFLASRSTSVLACSRAGAPLPLASHGMQSSLSGNTATPAYVRGRPSWAHVSISSGDEGVFDGQAPCREALSLRSCGRSTPLALLI